MRRRIVLGLIAVSIVGLLVVFSRLRVAADVGVGYVAKQMCSCIFVGERSLESCRPEMLPAMDNISAELISGGEGVRASVPLFGERVARHRSGRGCTLER